MATGFSGQCGGAGQSLWVGSRFCDDTIGLNCRLTLLYVLEDLQLIRWYGEIETIVMDNLFTLLTT